MRRALNENPLVQIALLGVMAVVIAVVFLMQMGGGEEQAAPAPTTPPAAEAPPAAGAQEASEAGAAAAGQPGSGADTAPADAVSPSSQPATAGGSLREGLPRSFVNAYEKDKPVAIFIVRDRPESDKTVGGYAGRLRAEGDASVITIGPDDLGKWVRVVGPVGVDRTPALVVVAPSADLGDPVASVSYGFRNYESVQQAVRDALYDGPVRGYDPG